jgi:hypothetical protein
VTREIIPLTQACLREIYHYDPATGVFTRRVKRGRRWVVGEEAGVINALGYRTISIDGRRYNASRLAWLYMTGEWPAKLVDHEDRNKANNRWNNLRHATKSQNNGNAVHRPNLAGLKGVAVRPRGRFTAQISIGNRNTYLGIFTCPAAAHFAYLVAAHRHFGEFARAA